MRRIQARKSAVAEWHPTHMSHASACFALQRDARSLFRETLARCSVQEAFRKLQTGDQDAVSPECATLRITGVRRLLIIAMGKGAASMTAAVLGRADLVQSREIAGVLVAPEKPDWLPPAMQYIRGGHPTPDRNSRVAAEAILRTLREENANAETLCLFLISGGGSSMVELPLDPNISIEDTADFHRALVHSGAPIAEINALRKHFSAVKGGRLAAASQHLRSFSALASDVPPAHLDALASGPTLPDTSTVNDCRRILHAYDLLAVLPASVQRFFSRPDLPETPKPSALDARFLVLLSQKDLAQAAANAAEERGFYAVVDDTPDDWPAQLAAAYLLERFCDLRRQHDRVCLISTGEVTVGVPSTLQGKAVGGRNQHFVLECATRIAACEPSLAVLSCGSDGVDGNSSAAGAVIASRDFSSMEMQARARDALAHYASGTFLQRMGAVIETGPTGINLRDIRLLLG